MENLFLKLDKEKFTGNLLREISKLPFGSLPKAELELAILHSIIEAYGGYDELNKNSLFIQRELMLTQTKFKNKVLEAQLRFDTSRIEPVEFFKEIIFLKEFSDLLFEENYLLIYLSNPFKRDTLKTYLDSIEVLNDASFNNGIIRIHSKGVLKILSKTLNKSELTKIESKIIKACEIKDNASFSLVGNMNLDSVFSVDLSFDPFKSAKTLLSIIRGALV